jgi:tetratricopeptide (TPR) repeat protein
VFIAVAPLLDASTGFAQKKRKAEPGSSPKNREAEFYFTEGEKYFILEDYAKALVYYQKALETNPSVGTVHYKIAEVLSKSSKQDDQLRASLSIEQALKLDPSNKYFYLLAVNIYNALGKFDKSAVIYENLIKQIPGTEDYLFELAAVYQYAHKYDDAIKTYTRAESHFGVNETSAFQKLRLYAEQSQLKTGIEEAEKLLRAYPDEERFVVGFCEFLSQKNEKTLATLYLEKFVADHPGQPGASMLLAGIYRDTQQEEKARLLLLSVFDNPEVEFNSKLIVLSTYNAELNQDKAHANEDTGKVTFAIQLFEKLEAAYPQEPSVHVIGGDLYLSIGKNKEAQQRYLLAIEHPEVSFEVWQNLLYLDIQLELYDQAIQHADKGLELYPNQNMLYYFKGYAESRQRKYREAVASLNQALRITNNNPSFTAEVNTILGDVYNGLKEYAKSDQAYDQALAVNPNNELVLNNYSFYLALRKTNLEKAEKMSAQLVKNNPDNPTFLDTHAWVLYTREKYREAKKYIERAIQTGRATATHIEHYGDILFQLGEVDEAVLQWEKAKSMGTATDLLNKKIANRKIYE